MKTSGFLGQEGKDRGFELLVNQYRKTGQISSTFNGMLDMYVEITGDNLDEVINAIRNEIGKPIPS